MFPKEPDLFTKIQWYAFQTANARQPKAVPRALHLGSNPNDI